MALSTEASARRTLTGKSDHGYIQTQYAVEAST